MSKQPPEAVMLRVHEDPVNDNEKPDDYDRIPRPLRALKRLALLPIRMIKGALFSLWRWLFGKRPKS